MPLDSSFHCTQIYIVAPEHTVLCIYNFDHYFECIETMLYFITLHSFKFCMVQLDAIQFFLTIIYSKECTRIHFWRNRPRIAILCTWLNDAFYFGIYLFVFDVILIGLSCNRRGREGTCIMPTTLLRAPPPFPEFQTVRWPWLFSKAVSSYVMKRISLFHFLARINDKKYCLCN